MPDILDLEALETPEAWMATLRLNKDLREAARLLSPQQQRILVDLYYQVQEARKRTANQMRHAQQEPNAWITFMVQFMQRMEKLAAGALDIASNQQAVSRWAKCAPPGAQVLVSGGRWSTGRTVPIEALQDGDSVVAFNRHKAALTHAIPITISETPYAGVLYTVETDAGATMVTPQHKWLTRFDADPDACIVYLMRQRDRFRVGWCHAVKPEADRRNGRLAVRSRARAQQADDVWILRFCASRREASVWESVIATQYGLPTLPFVGAQDGTASWGYSTAEIEAFFAELAPAEQYLRATACLQAHGRYMEAPLLSGIGEGTKESVGGLIVHTANLMPECMQIPVPLTTSGFAWRPVTTLHTQPYEGPVYSLDVPKYHSYVQDGLITRNSQFGIGPVIAAGLAARIDITRTPSVSALWSLAGQNPTAVWSKGELRPWNAHLKRLAFIIGDSFCKFHNHEKCIYGHLYAARKLLEVQRNAEGRFREQAEKTLATRNIKDKETRAIYEAGQLPAGRLELRARRVAVKRFLSHYWSVAYYEHYQVIPPLPYIVAEEPERHRHYVPPPGYEEIFVYPGLA